MGSKAVAVLLLFYLSASTFGIKLDGNGYTNILIAINPAVPENPQVIERIKGMVKNASAYLFQALDNRLYFKEVTILVPPNWSNERYAQAKTETYDKANIIIDEPNRVYGDEPYTLQYGQCGTEGRYIHFTPNFLLDDKQIDNYGLRGRVLVHEWAHLRWGVYNEYNEEEPFYISNQGNIEATRCGKDIQGKMIVFKDGGTQHECNNDPKTGLPFENCTFAIIAQATSSIMYMPLSSVVNFCSKETHNAEAPNKQNRMCDNRATLEVILSRSVDSGVLSESQVVQPLQPPSPPPNFEVVQRGHRVICLVLDVSGSMKGPRILRQKQAATLFIRHIVEDQAYLGIVTFSSDAKTLKPLNLISNADSRENLINELPASAGGGTYICKGLEEGFQVLRGNDKNTIGDEIILLTDGEADDIKNCQQSVKNSGAIVHTIALGPNADKALISIADVTGGRYFLATDNLDSNELVDVFASLTTSDGNLTQQTVQLESSGKKTPDWFNGTVSVDRTVGNNTSFTVVYETSPPNINIKNPTGSSYDQLNFKHDRPTKTLSLNIPGTAETGDWSYSLFNTHQSAQTLTMTVTSRAARADVHPVIVKAHMNQPSSNGDKPMLVYAEVSQKGVPVIKADVWATLESDKGNKQELILLDNGAGADAFRHDGIYSRYFTQFTSGRYNLKVKVKNQDGRTRFSLNKQSGALYIPAYMVDGKVVLNPPKPPVNDQPVEVGSFTRTATGESFVVELPPGQTEPPNFPPNKITDLNAKIQGDKVLLIWTAPGEDFDQGTTKSYEIRWSEDFELLRNNFSDAQLIDVSAFSPQEAGSTEELSFLPNNATIKNGTILFFAVQTEDKDLLRSATSNIAQVVKIVPRPPDTSASPDGNITTIIIIISVTMAVIVACLIVGLIICVRKRKFGYSVAQREEDPVPLGPTSSSRD